jgi:ABC-type multidrug transport system fused ATPase/permease subunit
MIREIIRLIPPVYRRQGVWVTFSVLLQALLNFAGLALLIPVLLLILDPQSINSYPLLEKLRTWTNIQNENVFVILICAATLGLLLSKNGLNLVINRFRINYANRLFFYFSEKLFESFFAKGFLFIKKNHTSSFAHKINRMCYIFAQGIVSRLFMMSGEILLSLMIGSALLFYSYLMALLLALCIFPATWLYYYRIRRKISQYGKEENEIWKKQTRLITETFRGYVDIRLNHAFPLFAARLREGLFRISFYRERIERIVSIPGSLTECGVAVGMALLVLFNQGDASMKVTFGIFAVAAMRLMPSVRTLIMGWMQLKNNWYVVDTIHEALTGGDSELQTSMINEQSGQQTILSFREKIEITNLTFRFPDAGANEPPVIQNFFMTVAKGERVGIRGVSGIGKTTLFNLLLGLYELQEGNIQIDGVSLDTATWSAWHTLIGYVPQDVFILDGTLCENIALGGSGTEINRKRIWETLETTRLSAFVSSLPEGIDTPIGENGCRLSGGQRQRIGIARALYKQVEVLFLDEATSSLDSATEKEITEAIRELSDNHKELTIIQIAHRESSLAFCDRIIDL